MEIETLILIYVLLWIIPCMVIASAKNKSVGKAFIASLFFGVFALIYYIFAGRESPAGTKSDSSESFVCAGCKTPTSREDKHCPGCGAPINWEEYRCKKCHHFNKEGAQHCSNCGHKLGMEKSAQQEQKTLHVVYVLFSIVQK